MYSSELPLSCRCPLPNSFCGLRTDISESVAGSCCGSDTRLAEIHLQVAPRGRQAQKERIGSWENLKRRYSIRTLMHFHLIHSTKATLTSYRFCRNRDVTGACN